MEYEDNITFEGKTLILEEAKLFHGEDSEYELNYRNEYYIYNIDTIYSDMEKITNYKTIFQLLYPFLLRFILKPHFRNRNMVFVFALEEKIDSNMIFSDVVVRLKYDGDHIRINPLIDLLYDKIENIKDDTPEVKGIKLIAIVKQIFEPQNSIENKNKTFRSIECVICLTEPPNVLFCNCGHIAICEECNKKESLEQCPICKTENTILRIIK